MFVLAPLILLGFSTLLASAGTRLSRQARVDRRFLQPRWSELWRVLIMLPPAILAEFYVLVVTALVGRTYWGVYVFVYVCRLAAFGPLCLSTSLLGAATRRLAIGILLLGTGLWLFGWDAEIHNPGWQF